MNLNEYVGNDFLLYNGNTLHVGDKNILLRNVKFYKSGVELSTYPNLGRFMQTGSGAVNKSFYLLDSGNKYTDVMGFAIKRWQAKMSNNAVSPGIISLRPVYKLTPRLGEYITENGNNHYDYVIGRTTNYIINSLTEFTIKWTWNVGGKIMVFNHGGMTITFSKNKSGSKSFTLEKGTDIRDLELIGDEFQATTSLSSYPPTPYSKVFFNGTNYPYFYPILETPSFYIEFYGMWYYVDIIIEKASKYAYTVANPKEWFDVPVTG